MFACEFSYKSVYSLTGSDQKAPRTFTNVILFKDLTAPERYSPLDASEVIMVSLL